KEPLDSRPDLPRQLHQQRTAEAECLNEPDVDQDLKGTLEHVPDALGDLLNAIPSLRPVTGKYTSKEGQQPCKDPQHALDDVDDASQYADNHVAQYTEQELSYRSQHRQDACDCWG